MPLHNVELRGLRLPKIGSIRKGAQVPVLDRDTGKPKKNAQGELVTRPKEMPHFVIKVDPAQESQVWPVLERAYGTREIMELNVLLALPNAFSNWSAWQEAYNFNQMIARSDERVVTYLYDTKTNQVLIRDGLVIEHSSDPNSDAGRLVANTPVGKPLAYDPEMVLAMPKTENGKPIRFKAVGRLSVVVIELKRLVTFSLITGGYWFDIPQIQSTVGILDDIANASGRGANTLPLKLRRVERERAYTDDDGKKKKKICYDIELEIANAATVAGLIDSYTSAPVQFLKAPTPQLPEGVIEGEEDFEDHGPEPIEAVPVTETPLPERKIRGQTKLAPGDGWLDPLNPQNVAWAATQWNIGRDQALKQIKADPRFYAPMPTSEFRAIVMGQPK